MPRPLIIVVWESVPTSESDSRRPALVDAGGQVLEVDLVHDPMPGGTILSRRTRSFPI